MIGTHRGGGMPNQQPTIFLSYAHSDQATALRIAKALENSGYAVWWDALIEGGTHFTSSIEEALTKADAVVVLWSKHSVDSDWVRDEAAQGRERHRLVPLSLDGTAPPLGFRQIQTIDLSGWRGRSDSPQIKAVCRAIATALGQAPPPRSDIPVSRRRAMALGAGTAVTLAAGLGAWQVGLITSARVNARSIAVLPFRNLSGDPDQDFLSEGLTEEVRTALARISGLAVAAATSSVAAAAETADARAIAGKLGVVFLLEGSVQRSGDMVRIATNLTNGRTGLSEWSQRVERRLDDIFSLQSEIARTVTNALSIEIATEAPVTGGTRNAAAYESYLRGKALYNRAKDEASDRRARAHFEVAIAADPKFALAHAALSRALASIAAVHASASELKPLYGAAIAEARRAVALEPRLAEGHLALGYALFAGRLDPRGARPSYDTAYRLGRGNADIVLLYAIYVVRLRRFAEARSAIERALALDPLNPRTHRAAGSIAYASRRFRPAVAHGRRALELNPQMSNAHALIGNAQMASGDLEAARAAYAAEPSRMFRLTGQAIMEHRLGNRPAAQQAYDQLVAELGDAALYQQAEVLAQWGDVEGAIATLRKARAVGDSGLSMIATDPLLDPIASDPRLVRLVREMGFA